MNISTNKILIGIAISIAVLMAVWVIAVENHAIGLEERISQSKAGITVQEKRQHDLILQLVQVVEQASRYESGVQTSIAQLRSAVDSGNDQQAQFYLNAVAESYPDLKANETYIQLMTEMSLSENLVTNYRDAYNADVRDYKRFVRRFPARVFLRTTGHEVIDYKYLSFDRSETTLPDELFSE